MLQTDTATLHFPPNVGADMPLVPQLFCVLEGGCPSFPVSRHALIDLDEIKLGRAAAPHDGRCERDPRGKQLAIRISDRWLSSDHAAISRQGEDFVFRDLRSKNGSRINGASVETATLRDGDIIELGQTFFVFRSRAMLAETDPHDFVISADQVVPGVATLQAGLNARFSDLGRIATTEVPVAVLGETGTGKELVARAVHQMSRREGAFIAVNCGGFPKDLVASELFGHTKGSFTGANADKVGLIRSADRGTLFLDEIGELPLEQQVILLRVLQDQTVTPIGGSPRKVGFRLVVATNRDMAAAISTGQFREDLWARASGFVMRLPPLRERREDLGLILGCLLARLREGEQSVTIRSDAAYALLRHESPQNIRELEQCMRAALALCEGDAVTFANLPESIRAPHLNRPPPDRPPPDALPDDDPAEALDELRQEHLRKLLERTGGNLSEVARLMGKHRPQIQRWIKRYGIDPQRYRQP